MIAKLKLSAYLILVVLAGFFAWKFFSAYKEITPIGIDADQITNSPPKKDSSASAGKSNPKTGSPSQSTNGNASTNTVTATNDSGTSNVVQQPATNSTVASTVTGGMPVAERHPNKSVGYLAGLVAVIIGLGLLIAYDITHFMGSRAVDFLYNDEGEGVRDPEYERAEAVWTNGKPLEAIEMMREYLKKNPREQHVALRIAEIYEKDLRNYLAAALEYEEVLKHRLPPERWGWAAIHLCNLYSRIGQQAKTKPLLERIATEYPQTVAAKKARRNLGLPEPVEAEAEPEEAEPEPAERSDTRGPVFDLDKEMSSTDEEAAPSPPPEDDEPPPTQTSKSNLPPGFRPKK